MSESSMFLSIRSSKYDSYLT